jgi:trimeric autotransporter adhesin
MSTVVTKNVQVGSSVTATNNFTIYQPASPDGTVRIANGNSGSTTDLVTVTSAGNVGVGTAAPEGKVSIQAGASNNSIVLRKTSESQTNPSLIFSPTDNSSIRLTAGTTSGFSSSVDIAGNNTGYIRFLTQTAERARIDSSGNLLVGTTSSFGVAGIQVISNTAGQVSMRHASAGPGSYWRIGPDSGGNNFVVYNQGSTGVYITDGSTGWTSSSDERIKDIIEPITDAANKVSSLRAVIGKYKKDDEGTRRAFLIAQDVQAVLPEAVNKRDDEIGTLGLQYTDVIPLLVAAIQELKAEFDAYKLSHP